jgi:hypothetical protein
VTSIELVFDEGNDVGVGNVVLDNIIIRTGVPGPDAVSMIITGPELSDDGGSGPPLSE